MRSTPVSKLIENSVADANNCIDVQAHQTRGTVHVRNMKMPIEQRSGQGSYTAGTLVSSPFHFRKTAAREKASELNASRERSN